MVVPGGSWVAISPSGVISKVAMIIAHIRGLITRLVNAHEPPIRLERHSGTLSQNMEAVQ